MKYIFSTIIFSYGFLHFWGFVKAFSIIDNLQFTFNISKLSGLICLFISALLITSAIAYLSKFQWWSVLLIFAIIFSVLLSILVWKEFKIILFINIIILGIACFSLAQEIFHNKVSNEIKQIIEQSTDYETTKVTAENFSELPIPVAKWLKNSGIVGREKINTVWLTQKAKMKMNPEQETWNNATAEQYFTINNPAFIWKLKMNMPPFFKITGRDKFFDGKGEMQIKMFSAINVVNAKGSKIDEGTMQRFLGEIIWFPSAALSPYIKWESIDAFSAKASMSYNGTKASGIFYFNKNGDFIKYSALRYKDNKFDAKRYEWIIDVTEHAIMEGVKIPIKMTVTWKLENGDWTWLEIEITNIKYNIKSNINTK